MPQHRDLCVNAYPPLPDETLETFVSQKYHWQTLSPAQVFSMALELYKYRQAFKEFKDIHENTDVRL